MSKEGGFMEFPRVDPGYRPKADRLQDWRAVEQTLPAGELTKQAARCMDCGTPFCHAYGCPLANVVPELNAHAYHGQWKEALDLLLATNPFPEFTGRICPALCEGSCVLGINRDPVTIRQLELAIIEEGFTRGLMVPRPPAARAGRSVAVVGSGPAGLAAADALNRRGFSVTVYENAARPGGILRYGIPDFKLEKSVVERRVRVMEAEGVVFECNVEGGRDVSNRFLASRFDAVLLTGGAREPRDLAVPGRELAGIHFAMDYLTQQNKRVSGEAFAEPEILAGGKKVVVLGGGDTGSDCLGTALRQGAVSVAQLEIMPKPPEARDGSCPWPLWPTVLRESSSHKEGGERRWSVTTKAFTGKDGRVTALEGCEVAWVKAAGADRPAPQDKPGTAFTLQADLVLLALGFTGPGKSPLADELGLKRDPRGNIARDRAGMSSREGVFVAGDMTSGASLVVRAIQDGLKAADHVAAWLAKRP